MLTGVNAAKGKITNSDSLEDKGSGSIDSVNSQIRNHLLNLPNPRKIFRGLFLTTDRGYTAQLKSFIALKEKRGVKQSCFIGWDKENASYNFAAIFEKNIILVSSTGVFFDGEIIFQGGFKIIICPTPTFFLQDELSSLLLCSMLMESFSLMSDNDVALLAKLKPNVKNCTSYPELVDSVFFPEKLRNNLKDNSALQATITQEFQKYGTIDIVGTKHDFLFIEGLTEEDGISEEKQEDLSQYSALTEPFITTDHSINSGLIEATPQPNKTRNRAIAAGAVIVLGSAVAGIIVAITRSRDNSTNVYCPSPYVLSVVNWSQQVECTICGDWPDVYYQNRNDTQLCLDSLMANRRAPSQIIERMGRLIQFSGMRNIDLSRQDWTQWSYSDWDGFLTRCENVTTGFQVFNLSSFVPQIISPDLSYMDLLNRFLSRIALNELDLTNQPLGTQALRLLASGLSNNPSLKKLYLANTGINAESMRALSLIITSKPLDKLDLSGSAINDDAAFVLAAALQNSTVTDLNLANSLMGEAGLRAVARSSTNGFLRVLDLSGINLPDGVLSVIGECFQYLQTIKLNNCLLDSDNFAVLSGYASNSTVENFSFNDNQIKTRPIAVFLRMLPANFTKSFKLNNNKMQGQIEQLIDGINSAGIDTLAVGGNPMAGSDYAQLIIRTQNVLTAIDVSDSPMTDDDVLTVAESLQPIRLKKIDLSGLSLTDKSVVPFLQAATNTPLQQVSLARNFIVNALTQVQFNFNHSQLTSLDLESNLLKEITSFVSQLRTNHRFKNLVLNYNPLIDVLSLAKALISPINGEDKLSEQSYSPGLAQNLVHAQPATSLTQIDLIGTGLNETSKRAICRVAPAGDFLQAGIRFSQASTQNTGDLSECQTMVSNSQFMQTSSAAARTKPLSSHLWSHLEIIGSALQETIKAIRKIRFTASRTEGFFEEQKFQSELFSFDSEEQENLSSMNFSRGYRPEFFNSSYSNTVKPIQSFSIDNAVSTQSNNWAGNIVSLLLLGLVLLHLFKKLSSALDFVPEKVRGLRL